jgi:hypothetical protein
VQDETAPPSPTTYHETLQPHRTAKTKPQEGHGLDAIIVREGRERALDATTTPQEGSDATRCHRCPLQPKPGESFRLAPPHRHPKASCSTIILLVAGKALAHPHRLPSPAVHDGPMSCSTRSPTSHERPLPDPTHERW